MTEASERKLQLLESRFWETNESGGHPFEVERGWRPETTTKRPIGDRSDIDKLLAEDARLERELAQKREEFAQELEWLQRLTRGNREAMQSFLVNAHCLLEPAEAATELKVLALESDVAPELAKAMIFKGGPSA